MEKSLLLLFSLSLFSVTIRAQTGNLYSTDNELSGSLINSIYQDSRNYIWIATEDGLNRFDGVRFTIYKSRPNDSTAIKNNYVRTVFEDSNNRFWIGCINGLQRYNRTTDCFIEVPLFNSQKRIYPHITSIIESKEDEIWIATSGQGVIRIKENDSTFTVDESLSDKLSSIHLTAIYQDSKGRLWIASENQGLNRYDPIRDEVTIFKSPVDIGSDQISAVAEDHDGNVFVGTLTNGLYRLDPERDRFEPVPHVDRTVLYVKSLLVDKHNRLLVGTDGQGMKLLNKSAFVLEDYQTFSIPFDFSKMKVHAICQDHAGNVWMGLFQKGVFLSPENPNKFKYWGYKSRNQDIIGSGCVMSVLRDREGTLWVGTDNDGMYKIDRQGKSTHFQPDNSPHSVPNTIMSIAEDKNGNIWLGSYLQGLSLIDKNTGRCTYYNNPLDSHTENRAGNKIFALTIDNKNQLWVGTSGNGAYIFNIDTRKYTEHFAHAGNEQQNDWYINSILCDKDGLIWIGSYDGISLIDPNDNKVESRALNNIPTEEVVYCTNEDSKGNLWIGTAEGLVCYNKKSRNARRYNMSNGLSSNVICGILEDESNNIWISTHSGISKLSLDDNKIVNFYAFDGLQGNEFSMGAACKTSDGEMYFGGIGGVSAFYPSEISGKTAPLNVYLTALYAMNSPVVAGQRSGKNSIFDGFIADVDTITLSHRDNIFALEFTTFDFGASGRIRYNYLLEGLKNTQWLTTEQGVNRINFTNITHGVYKLRVKAAIYDTSSDEKIITIIITPPWYLAWWAKAGYVILFALLVSGIAKYILERIKHKNEMLQKEHTEQISEAKLQFFINVSHEIRTPMTLIISPLEKLMATNTDQDIQKTYILMHRNARRILRLINQLMDVRKIDKGLMKVKFRETDIVGFIEDLFRTFEYAADRQRITFTFEHKDERMNVWIDLNNFDKVLMNILSNAFKFTPENGAITVTLQKGHNDSETSPLKNYFEISIADTGIGIEADKIEKIFERFYQINEVNSPVNFGTGVGLHLARSLVNLQHGILFARNRTDRQGSEFIIRLPLGKAHLSPDETENVDFVLSESKSKPPLTALPTEPYTTADEQEKTNPKTKYRILIVDDEEDVRNYLLTEFSRIYKVYEAVNGKAALDFILKEKPDLVISDIMMHGMDGVTLTRKIKSNINVKHIPVILLTAKSSDKDRGMGLDVGADAYIAKPFNMELLKKAAANIIENRERLSIRATDTVENRALIKPVILKSSDQILYEKIIKIINDNIDDSDLNVDFLAAGVGMSRVHMHRKLKELTNMSARDFIKTIRLKQAADLLAGQKLTVSEVAYALGYVNLSHFSNSFHEFHGMSPKEYADKHANKK
ncbi:MAG: response regulator [Prevotellaceae bacterium]|jgi:ligand-binding sensor domain-containing protein/signal transduction histidine kinase/CheY-like chemotaxis protein/AraC-like DNA-binding protein|nr:response regulator [Prevotellaceae bacterium]